MGVAQNLKVDIVIFVLHLLGKGGLWKARRHVEYAGKQSWSSQAWKEGQRRNWRCQTLNVMVVAPVALCICTCTGGKQILCECFGVQSSYISKYLLRNLAQSWLETLTNCDLWHKTTESTLQGHPVPTLFSREVHSPVQLIILTAKEIILAHCGLVRLISLFLHHRGTLMVFLLTCDLLTAVRI